MSNNYIKKYEVVFTESEDSYFDCLLNNNRKIEISLWSFYEFAVTDDKDLKDYALKFHEWEDLTRELTDFGYPFEKLLNKYIQQFSEEDLEDFTFPVEDKYEED